LVFLKITSTDNKQDIFMKKFDFIGEIWQMSDYYSLRHEKRDATDYPRKSTGEYPILYPSRGTFAESRRLGLFSGFRIGCDFWPNNEKLEAMDPEHEIIQIDMLRSTTDYERPENRKLGISYEEFTEKYYNAAIDFSLTHPGRVMLCAVGEIDSSHPWPKDYSFRTRKEAYEFFKYNVFHTKIGSCDPDALYKLLEKRGLSFEQVGLMIHGACLFAIPYYFEWGFPYIEIERGLGTSLNMQVSLAYLRGAWKQNGRKAKWGIDFSTHQANFNQCIWYDESGVRNGGFTESLIERCWLYSWLGGADFLLNEGSDYGLWTFKKDGSFTLSELGETTKKFADFTLRGAVERGEPEVPCAVILAHDNGYEQECGVVQLRPSIWGNTLPCTNADMNIGNIFSEFFPGQEHVCTATECVTNSDCGYRTRYEYLEQVKRGEDMRKYESGHLTPSPYGDSLDVLWDNASIEVMREYKVIVPAGTAKLPETVLKEYVAQGGTLCAGIEKFSSQMLDELGIEKLPPLASDWEYDAITLADGSFSSDGLRYGFVRVKAENAEILASNSRKIPIVLSIPYGTGKVMLCTIPFGQDISGLKLIGAWGFLIGKEVMKYLPVKFDSQGILQAVVNRTSSGYLLGLFNNTEKTWSGKLEFDNEYVVKSMKQIYPELENITICQNGCEAKLIPFSNKIIRVEI
jgi:hypothetical protein